MKICTGCNEEKPLNQFHIRSKEKGTYNPRCKACKSKGSAERYQNGYREKQLISTKKSNEELKTARRNYVRRLKCLKGCAGCGDDRYQVLEFHHRDPSTKIGTIATAIAQRGNGNKLLQEIDKCDILCANCHLMAEFELHGS